MTPIYLIVVLCSFAAFNLLRVFIFTSNPSVRPSVHPLNVAVPDPLQDAELLDILLVASVDGNFHALNRTTGHTLWSMPSSAPCASQPTLAPLIRTSVPDGAPQDPYTYIIEPQSGDIYVMATPSSPLQRFPFSISDLVDMSPFSFSAADDHRIFVGRKETSLFVLELETGSIKVASDAACPWNPFEGLRDTDLGLDLDELEELEPKPKPTEVFIGRTDYHVTIHARPSDTHRIPVHNLSFSTYGPHTQDSILQASYRNTKDDTYVQSLPNGEIISFKVRGEAQQNSASDSVLWAYKFSSPIVAIFDVLRTASQHPPNTFVLLQPRPQLSAILPKLHHATSMDQLPHLESAYIRMVEETGSLFAMSPDLFPLVAFGGGGGRRKIKIMEAPVGTAPGEFASEVDAVTAARKQRERLLEKAMRERDYGSDDDRCLDRASLYTDRRCLVGIRRLEGGDGDGPESRMRRLIDGVPGVLWP
ncbi:hypothetical protein FB451DRAFT_131660 [Mycena latifolia]|nr:hypothetical protein FB451DRAFT_131660 [Mycena latifolia]